MRQISDNQNKPQMSTSIDDHISDYIEILKRRKWVIILFFLIVVGSVTTFSLIATPQYKTSAKILLGGQPTPMNPLGESPQRVPEINLYYQTQVNLLKSRSLARSVIESLDIQDVQQEKALSNTFSLFTGIFDLIKSRLSAANTETVRSDASSEHQPIENLPKTTADSSIHPERNADTNRISPRLLNWYLNKLEVLPVRNSSLVTVSFTGPNAELIARIVNTHANTAIQNTIHQHQAQAMSALEWLKAQITEQKKEVQSSQRAIYDFKKQHNALSLDDSQIIKSQELQELNSALTRAKTDRMAKQAAYMELKSILDKGQSVLQMQEISDDPVIQNLRNQLVNLMSEKIELGTNYGPKHPKIIEINRGIAQLNNEIITEKKRLVKAIRTDLNQAMALEKSIRKSLESQKAIAMSLGEQTIEYDVLKQQAASSQDVYDFLLKQSEEIALSSAIRSSNMHIVDEAEIPAEPVSPNLKLNILLSVFLSLFMGVGLSLLLEYIDNTVKTPMDVAVRLGMPVLGMIPFHKALQGKNSMNPLLTAPNDKSGESLPLSIYHISNRLPDELRSPAEGLFGRVLIVESATMNEGKTTVISRIASNLTDAGLRVLLVDCDFQRPSLDKLFEIKAQGGLGKSIDRIMRHNLSSGTLTEFSMDDLFFLIALKKLNGRLFVNNEDQTLVAFFQNGVLVHIQNKNSPVNNRIGTMLSNGGFITDNQLSDAMERHKRTGQPLGYILVNAGYIGREKLRGPLRLQIEEYLQKMFSWKRGNFVFKPGVVQLYENERIYFEEDYSPMIYNLGRIEHSKFIERELLSQLVSLSKENLYIMPAGSSYKLIGSMNLILMKKVFEKLKQHFDVLLVDTPPLDAASGIESIFPLADSIVVVIRAGHLSVKELNSALTHLPQDKIIGTILNQVKTSPNPYY
jgi:polysaccharide biosynthesis transport protein